MHVCFMPRYVINATNGINTMFCSLLNLTITLNPVADNLWFSQKISTVGSFQSLVSCFENQEFHTESILENKW